MQIENMKTLNKLLGRLIETIEGLQKDLPQLFEEAAETLQKKTPEIVGGKMMAGIELHLAKNRPTRGPFPKAHRNWLKVGSHWFHISGHLTGYGWSEFNDTVAKLKLKLRPFPYSQKKNMVCAKRCAITQMNSKSGTKKNAPGSSSRCGSLISINLRPLKHQQSSCPKRDGYTECFPGTRVKTHGNKLVEFQQTVLLTLEAQNARRKTVVTKKKKRWFQIFSPLLGKTIQFD